jgi:hypothetical protein
MGKATAICLGAVAATCWLAVAGLSAAPALAVQETTICISEHAATQACPVAERYAPRVYEASGEAVILASPIEVKCGMAIVFKTTSSTGQPLTANITSLTLTGCVDHHTGTCTSSSVMHLPFVGEASWTGSDIGKFNVVSGGTGVPEFKLVCGTTCTYKASPMPMVWIGGPFPATPLQPPLLNAELNLTRVAGTCVATAQFGTSMNFTSPTELYVEHT